MNLYIAEQGLYVRINQNQVIIEKNKIIIEEIPIKIISSVTVVGNVFLTTQVISNLVKLKIPISYMSTKGYYKFSIRSDYNVNIERQELQFNAFNDEDYTFLLSKKTILSKVKNQLLVLRRYNRNTNSCEVLQNIDFIQSKLIMIDKCTNKQELLGFEGIVAKYYFDSIKYLVPKTFNFLGRKKNPSTDPINSILSFCYTLLLNLFINCLENKKLNPYKSFMHVNKIGHPSLASDLMEEYRPIIVDSLVLNLVRRKIIKVDDFYKNSNYVGMLIKNDAIKIIIKKFEEKINLKKKYISENAIDTKNTIYLQLQSLIQSFSEKDVNLFQSVVYR